jgi:Tfp pilus assembly protein PilO
MNTNIGDSKQKTRFHRDIQPLLLQKKTAHYTPTILTFLAVSLFGWYAVRPTLQTIIYLKREIKDLDVVNTKMNDKINNLIEAQSNLQSVEPLIPAVLETLPQNPNVQQLLQSLRIITQSTQASISGITVNSNPIISTQDVRDTSKPLTMTPLTFSMTIDGDYNTIVNIIDKLLTLRRIIHIQSYRLSPASKRQDQTLASIQVTLQLETYYSN